MKYIFLLFFIIIVAVSCSTRECYNYYIEIQTPWNFDQCANNIYNDLIVLDSDYFMKKDFDITSSNYDINKYYLYFFENKKWNGSPYIQLRKIKENNYEVRIWKTDSEWDIDFNSKYYPQNIYDSFMTILKKSPKKIHIIKDDQTCYSIGPTLMR